MSLVISLQVNKLAMPSSTKTHICCIAQFGAPIMQRLLSVSTAGVDLGATYAGVEGKRCVYIEEVISSLDKDDLKAALTKTFQLFGTVESVVVGFQGRKDAHVWFETAASAVCGALSMHLCYICL